MRLAVPLHETRDPPEYCSELGIKTRFACISYFRVNKTVIVIDYRLPAPWRARS